MPVISLSWSQVNAWRCLQHDLIARAAREELDDVVRRTGGIQAQLMSAAELALWARLEDNSAEDVERALWEERSLVKTWAMRGTLHLLSAAELPLYVAARQAVEIRRPPSYFTYHEVTPDQYDAIQEHVPQVLSETPITRQELAQAVAERAGDPDLREVLLSGWGALLKPVAFRGELCFGPNQGQNVTFVRPSLWLPEPEEEAVRIEPYPALQALARRYLWSYGPANPEDFGRWWGIQAGPAKKLFRSLDDEIQPVGVEGWQAWALAVALERMESLESLQTVRLLPLFDAYTVGVARDCEPILPAQHKGRVYRPQGWISAVVMVDGRMAGTWEYETKGGRTAVRACLFSPLGAEEREGLADEAERLGEFLGAPAELAIGGVG